MNDFLQSLHGPSIVVGIILVIPLGSIIANWLVNRTSSPTVYPAPCRHRGATVQFDAFQGGWRCTRCGRGLPSVLDWLRGK